MGRRNGAAVAVNTRLALVDLMPRYCYYCNEPFSSKRKMTVEHIVPVCRGGSNHISNLALTCYLCNQKKDSLTGVEFLEYLGRAGEPTRVGHRKGEPEMGCFYRLNCAYCGEDFLNRHAEARYCSAQHRVKHKEYHYSGDAPLFTQLAKSYGLFGFKEA